MKRSNSFLCIERSQISIKVSIKGNIYVKINTKINQVEINKSGKKIFLPSTQELIIVSVMDAVFKISVIMSKFSRMDIELFYVN